MEPMAVKNWRCFFKESPCGTIYAMKILSKTPMFYKKDGKAGHMSWLLGDGEV